MARIQRNKPCPCGSGKKYKKCCGPRDAARESSLPATRRGVDWPEADGRYLRLRVSLRVEGPAIWRTILLRRDASFAELHHAIQACGWADCHLWSFSDAAGTELARRADDGDPFGPVDAMFGGLFGRGKPAPDAETVPLAGYFRAAGDHCVYCYDFGDNWEHDVRLEAVERHEGGFLRALCDGEGTFPPEDCGGVPGWSRLVAWRETGRDPWDDPESLEQWLAQRPFEPFDLAAASRAFGAVLQKAEATRSRVREIDPPLVGGLVQHTEAMLREFVHEEGLAVRVKRASYSDINVRFEVEVSVVREDGIVMNKQAEDFLDRCEEVGLSVSDLGRVFQAGSESFRIIGLRPRARHPVLCEKVGDEGETLTSFDAAYVSRRLGGGARAGGATREREEEAGS